MFSLENLNIDWSMPLKSDGAGNALHYRVKHNEQNFHLKVSMISKKALHNSNRVEAQIFEHILKPLQKHTPCLPEYYGTFFAPSTPELKKAFRTLEDYRNYNLEKSQIIAIEDLCELSETTLEILFQIIYTIACFERVGFRHGDLHTGNVLVKKLDQPTTLNFQVLDKTISITTSNVVKIIDYDFATVYHPEVERNRKLDDYEECYNGIKPGADMLRFLCDFIKIEKNRLGAWLNVNFPALENWERNCIIYENPENYLGTSVNFLQKLTESFPETFTVNVQDPIFILPEPIDFSYKGENPHISGGDLLKISPIKNPIPIKFIAELNNLGFKFYNHFYSKLDLSQPITRKIAHRVGWDICPLLIGEEEHPCGIFYIPQKSTPEDYSEAVEEEEEEEDEYEKEVKEIEENPLPGTFRRILRVHGDLSLKQQKQLREYYEAELVFESGDAKKPTYLTSFRAYNEHELNEARYKIEAVCKSMELLPKGKTFPSILSAKWTLTKKTALNVIRELLNLSDGVFGRQKKIASVYCIFVAVSRMTWFPWFNIKFIRIMENKISEFATKEKIDFGRILREENIPPLEEFISG